MDEFLDHGSLHNRSGRCKVLLVGLGDFLPILHTLALELLGKPYFLSPCKKSWNTYFFINSIKRNNITHQHVEYLVFACNNLCLLSRKSPNNMLGAKKMWDFVGDAFIHARMLGYLRLVISHRMNRSWRLWYLTTKAITMMIPLKLDQIERRPSFLRFCVECWMMNNWTWHMV